MIPLRLVIDASITYRLPVAIAAGDEDPGDDMFVECADAARAEYLLTGNQRQFPKF